MKFLLAHGADPNKKFLNKTPVTWAEQYGYPEIVAVLKQAQGEKGEDGPGTVADRKKRRAKPVPVRDHVSDATASVSAPPAPGTTSEKKPSGFPVVSDVDQPVYSSPSRPNDFALVVGIENYASLPEAKFAERDAAAMQRHLLALGLPPRNIVTLTGSEATRGKLQGYLQEWLPRNVKQDSSLFFYFSGHGAPDPATGQAYLVPWDGDAKFLESTAYPIKQLHSNLAKLHVKHTIVALDACFSGAGGRSVLAPGARPLVTRLAAVTPAEGMVILSAASSDEITGTIDVQGHGAFTYFLLKGLNAGKRSARALFQYAKPEVQDEAHRQNREQTPTFLGKDSDF